jgi:hypothetical protein
MLASDSWAPIFSSFPGLPKLIERADLIVVAKIAQQTGKSDIGGGSVFRIEVLKSLKGNLSPGATASVYLRNLPFSDGRISVYTVLQQWTAPGDWRILFLNKATETEKDFEYRNENASGDSIRIAPDSNLSKLSGKNVQEDISVLINETVTYEESRLKTLKQVAKTMTEKK